MEYTKGEWKVDKQGEMRLAILDSSGYILCEIDTLYHEDEALANAYLIATSTKMYEALKKALLLLEYITTEKFARGGDKPVRELLTRVLARAEGKE